MWLTPNGEVGGASADLGKRAAVDATAVPAFGILISYSNSTDPIVAVRQFYGLKDFHSRRQLRLWKTARVCDQRRLMAR